MLAVVALSNTKVVVRNGVSKKEKKDGRIGRSQSHVQLRMRCCLNAVFAGFFERFRSSSIFLW